jgi:hypothetical protein
VRTGRPVAERWGAQLTDMLAIDPLAADCPLPWRRWVTGRHYLAIISARIEDRTPHDQQRQDHAGWKVLNRVYVRFADRPTGF